MATVREDPARRDERRASTTILLDRIDRADDSERRPLEDKLIAVNIIIAHAVASRYRGRGIDSDDLDQVACMGLVKAVRGYDAAKATDFLGYAVPTIRGEVRRHFRDRGWAVRPPRGVQELQPRVRRARGELWQQLGRDARPEEVSRHLGMDLESVREALAAEGCFAPSSLDAAPDEGIPVGERLGENDPAYGRAEARVTLRPLLRGLSDRERRILQMRFCDGRTQAEIGQEIGVTQMQVSRLLAGLLHRLRLELSEAA